MAEGKYACALRVGRKESVGMHTHKQIGLHLSGFLNPHMQRHKVVCIARQEGSHGIAFDSGGIDSIAQFQGDLQNHIFFFGAIGANGTRVLSAMTCVNGDHN